MAEHVADHILSRLREWQIRHIVAYPVTAPPSVAVDNKPRFAIPSGGT